MAVSSIMNTFAIARFRKRFTKGVNRIDFDLISDRLDFVMPVFDGRPSRADEVTAEQIVPTCGLDEQVLCMSGKILHLLASHSVHSFVHQSRNEDLFLTFRFFVL